MLKASPFDQKGDIVYMVSCVQQYMFMVVCDIKHSRWF